MSFLKEKIRPYCLCKRSGLGEQTVKLGKETMFLRHKKKKVYDGVCLSPRFPKPTSFRSLLLEGRQGDFGIYPKSVISIPTTVPYI